MAFSSILDKQWAK